MTLGSTYMEDQFVPLAAHFGDPEGMSLAAMPQMIVHVHHWIAAGSNVPTSAVFRGVMAMIALPFRLLGYRPLPPVFGWDARAMAA